MPVIKVATGIYINGQQQFVYKQEEDTQSMSGLKAMLKSAREEAATYRIKAREKAEAKTKLEGLEGQITYYKELYQHFKSKYEAATSVIVDDPFLPIEEKQKETVEKYIKEPLFNKEQTMKPQLELTEDASLYWFPKLPNCKIVEISIAKDFAIRETKWACKIDFINSDGALKYITTDIHGSPGSTISYDIELKPVPKTRPMTHEEIMELRAKSAMFGKEGWEPMTFTTIMARTNLGEYVLHTTLSSTPTVVKLEKLITDWRYSLDNTKTWHPLTVEEK